MQGLLIMSKLGGLAIKIPLDVELDVGDKSVVVRGPKGVLTVNKDKKVKVNLNNGFIEVRVPEDKAYSVLCGLTRAQVNNAVIGVSEGYTINLEIVGVGYRVEKIGQDLKFSVGYSHPVLIKAPEGILFDLEGNTNIKVTGIDKQVVGQVSAHIRDIRRPEPYKGKGIKYKDEIIRRKQGKAAKGAS